MSEHALEDTQELDLSELQDDPEAAALAKHLPQPAVVRAAVLGVVSLVGAVIGRELNLGDYVDVALDIYTVAGPAAIYFWVHRKLSASTVKAVEEVAAEHIGKHRKAT